MGMLMDFYTGDTERIIDALKSDDRQMLTSSGIVSAHVDLSFHLGPDDLDQLVRSACALLNRPAMTFAQSIESDIMVCPPDDPETGIHRMSNAFVDLFAAIAPARSAELLEIWMAQWPDEPPIPPATTVQRFMRRIRRGVEFVLGVMVFIPLLAAYWLLSRRFREDRRRNRRKRAAAQGKTASTAEYTLKEGIAALITTCQAAKAQGKDVVYAWSL